MNKMKTFILLALMMLSGVSMQAQWQPDSKEAMRLDNVEKGGQLLVKSLRTPEGKTVVTWLRGETIGEDTKYVLHMQILDAKGNAQFGDEGIIISDKPTLNYTTLYETALAENGDIIIGYSDMRNSSMFEETRMYVYRYNQQGQPVWDANGIPFEPIQTSTDAISTRQENAKFCTSGDNLYVAINQSEYIIGDETSSVGQKSSVVRNWQLWRLNADGTRCGSAPLMLNATVLQLVPAPNGDVYVVYDNEVEGHGIVAMRLDKNMHNLWGLPVMVESESIMKSPVIPEPLVGLMSDGSLTLCYKKLLTVRGYQVVKHLSPEGDVQQDAVICNGTTNGNCEDAIMAVRDDKLMMSMTYVDDAGMEHLYVNEMDEMGNYQWTGYDKYGIGLEHDDLWGFIPYKLIPQEDGWVIVYGQCTYYNCANTIVTKLNEQGQVVWSKRIGNENLEVETNRYAVTYDENNVYFFYGQVEHRDSEGKIIPGSGGLYAICANIKNGGGTSGISDITPSEESKDNGKWYTIGGTLLNGAPTQPGIYLHNGKKIVINR